MYPRRISHAVKFLLRYGELGLKGRHVRAQMKRRLRENVLRLLRGADPETEVSEKEGRLFVETEHPDGSRLLGRVFGVVSFSPVWETDASLESISAKAVQLAGQVHTRGIHFAVRTRRVGEHRFTSADTARVVGSAILSALPDLKVDLTEPDWEIHVEVRGAHAFLFSEILPGVGGLPLGTQGKVVGLVETAEGVAASWLMMKRGCYVLSVSRSGEKWAAELRAWDLDLRWQAIEALEEMSEVAEEAGALGFVYPWTTPGNSENDLRPAFYPLIGLDAKRLASLRARVLGPA